MKVTTLNVKREEPGWKFFLLWFIATFIGGQAYALPVGAIQIVLGLDRLDDPQRAAELTARMLVLAAVLCGAACGLTIGLAQWLVLRREIKPIGAWMIATIVGYASIGGLPLIAGLLQPVWLNWAFTLIINGKMHWLARVEPEWLIASWMLGAITLTLFGIVLGFAQWLVLRGRVDHAAWWIVFSTLGWALVAAVSAMPTGVLMVLALWDIPAIVGGAGWVWLLRRSARTLDAAEKR